MKLEIDLKELLIDDESGDKETLSDSIRRLVVEKLTAEVSKGIRAQVNAEVSRVLSEELSAAVKEKMPALIKDLLSAEYRPVNRYGDQDKVTTMRKELIKTITSEMEYKKSSYDHSNNAFTKAVDQVIAENVRIMQKDFDKKVCEMFQAEAFKYAMQQMAKKLEVSVKS